MRKIRDQQFDIFIPSEKIENRISEMANQINLDYRDKDPLFLSILNGAFIFTADLFRENNHSC